VPFGDETLAGGAAGGAAAALAAALLALAAAAAFAWAKGTAATKSAKMRS
jgi:hypothetical protein